MRDYIRTFNRDGVTVVTEVRNGERLPTRYVRDGQELAPPKKEPRRIESKRNAAKTSKPAKQSRPNFLDCIHQLGAIGETTEHKCGGCPGGQFTTVCECELFGKCAPMAWAPTPDPSVRRCVDCPKYAKSLPPAPPAE